MRLQNAIRRAEATERGNNGQRRSRNSAPTMVQTPQQTQQQQTQQIVVTVQNNAQVNGTTGRFIKML